MPSPGRCTPAQKKRSWSNAHPHLRHCSRAQGGGDVQNSNLLSRVVVKRSRADKCRGLCTLWPRPVHTIAERAGSGLHLMPQQHGFRVRPKGPNFATTYKTWKRLLFMIQIRVTASLPAGQRTCVLAVNSPHAYTASLRVGLRVRAIDSQGAAHTRVARARASKARIIYASN